MEIVLKENGLYAAKLIIINFFKKFELENIDDFCLKANVSKYKLPEEYKKLSNDVNTFNVFGWDLIKKDHLLKEPNKPKSMVVEGINGIDYQIKFNINANMQNFDYTNFEEKPRVFNLVIVPMMNAVVAEFNILKAKHQELYNLSLIINRDNAYLKDSRYINMQSDYLCFKVEKLIK